MNLSDDLPKDDVIVVFFRRDYRENREHGR